VQIFFGICGRPVGFFRLTRFGTNSPNSTDRICTEAHEDHEEIILDGLLAQALDGKTL